MTIKEFNEVYNGKILVFLKDMTETGDSFYAGNVDIGYILSNTGTKESKYFLGPDDEDVLIPVSYIEDMLFEWYDGKDIERLYRDFNYMGNSYRINIYVMTFTEFKKNSKNL